MKRYLIMIVAVLSAIAVFTGCSTGNTSSSATTATAVSSAAVSSSPTASGSGRVFTMDELKKYDGQNGNPAYVAVNGIVYDVTNVKSWNNGTHHGHQAGTDLTEAIKQSPHGDSVLSGLPVVGTLQK